MDPLSHASIDGRTIGVDDAELFQEVKVGHVYYAACHLLETKICDLSERCESRDSLASRWAVEKRLQEDISANRVEHLIVSELTHPESLIQPDAPKRNSW